ncbi:MAG: AAA family ATPase, partial [Bryobacteraceae bacterium]
LSTGTVQRLSLARALLHSPAVLVLDEPTRSLDPLAAAEFRHLLREEVGGNRGTTLLFASHTLAEVEEVASRIALLDRGRLLFLGSAAAMRERAGAATLEEAMRILIRRSAPGEDA